MVKIKFTIITLFKDAISPYLNTSMMWKAQDKGIAEFDFVDLREYGIGPHRSVDDTPYGGGDGMLMRCEPIYAAIEAVLEKARALGEPKPEVILPTPDGAIWNQATARKFAEVDDPDMSAQSLENSITKDNSSKIDKAGGATKHYIILCPHYEGYDERILPLVDHKVSLGSYVLTGGELPALVIIDSIVRLLPGVLGGKTSALVESFSEGNNIEFPQYTKPADFRGLKVPDVLLSGDHGKVATWRKAHEKHGKSEESLEFERNIKNSLDKNA